MLRPILYEALLFLLPFILYGVWLVVRRRNPTSLEGWEGAPILYLLVTAAVTTMVGLALVGHFGGAPAGSRVCARTSGERRPHRAALGMTTAFPWLGAPPLADLLERLDQGDEEARVVGGAVRNTLLGEPVSEWDIATTALPDEVSRRARACGWKVVPTGLEHGTVTVVVSGVPFEVTTLRQDVATDGRHAVVRFGRDFKADAFRRDFTINALSVGRDGRLHDYAGGLADLRARRVRFIGDPDQRIAEDYLRILRLFRFHARYGQGAVDTAGMEAAIRARGGLSRLSRERIRAEVLKLVAAPGAPAVTAEIDGAGFLLAVLGGVARPSTLARLAAMEAQCGIPADAVRRLGVLAMFVREDATRIAERLRLSRAEAGRLAAMAAAGERLRHPPTPQATRAALYAMGRDGFPRRRPSGLGARRRPRLVGRARPRRLMAGSRPSLHRPPARRPGTGSGSASRARARRGGAAMDRGGFPGGRSRAGGHSEGRARKGAVTQRATGKGQCEGDRAGEAKWRPRPALTRSSPSPPHPRRRRRRFRGRGDGRGRPGREARPVRAARAESRRGNSKARRRRG